MTVREAAALIGCSLQQVRTLVRSGILRAKKVPTDTNQHGYEYQLHHTSVLAYSKKPQKQGWPRGQSWEYEK